MKFNVSGKINLGGEERVFSRQVEAESEAKAKHLTYALFGSNNGLKRNMVKIEKGEKAK